MDTYIKDLLLLGVLTIVGFYFGRAIRRVRLPQILGYMLLGSLLGSSVTGILTEPSLLRLNFFTEITLALIAFVIGSELNLAALKRQGRGIVIVILGESFMAFFVVMALVYLFTRDLPLALILGAMAPASAPAGTVAVIQEYRATGSLTKAIYAVVGFDDGLAIIIYGFAAALAKTLLIDEGSGVQGNILASFGRPLLEIVLCLGIGGAFGMALTVIVKRLKQSSDYLIIVIGFTLLTTGVCKWLNISLILTNMIVGFVLVNTRREALVANILAPVNTVVPFLFIMFFALAGAHLNLKMLPSLGTLGVLYIVGRFSGLISGAWLGARIGRMEDKIRKYLGLGILSQAGVAIGLSLIFNHDAATIGTPHAVSIGKTVIIMITATSIFFEILGPILTKIALDKAGEIETQ
ncbi:cation:proton antiporter [candidate division KSB1 bacterium]